MEQIVLEMIVLHSCILEMCRASFGQDLHSILEKTCPEISHSQDLLKNLRAVGPEAPEVLDLQVLPRTVNLDWPPESLDLELQLYHLAVDLQG